MVRYSFANSAIYEGNLILVNREHPLKIKHPYRNYELTKPVPRFPEILLRNVATTHLKEIFRKIGSKEAIVPVSGYRSLREQTELYNSSWEQNGEEYTKKFVARPNESEHQTGLAIDVAEYSEQIDFICPKFSYNGVAGKFREVAAEYGFIERYPKGKEEITGIAHEPWHFRYVGVPHAKIMTMLGMTMEEYMFYLKQFPYHIEIGDVPSRESENERGFIYQSGKLEYHIYYVKADSQRTTILLPSDSDFELSGNNVDGFILTIKKPLETGGMQS